MPTMDTSQSYEVKFQENPNQTLLEADSCFNRVVLPLNHKNYKDFKAACLISLQFGGVGYGRV